MVQEDLPIEGCSNPLRAARRSPHGVHASGKKRGTLNSRLGSLPDDSQARNSWLGWQSGTFCRLPTARSGNGVKNISHARTLTVKTPTGAHSAVPPLLCLLRGGVPQCRQSLCCLPI